MFNAQNRIRQLMNERGWTIYRLAQESGLSQTTISNIFKRNNQPSLPTVNAICDACGITLAQFFTENDTANSPNAKSELDDSVAALKEDQREALAAFIKTIVISFTACGVLFPSSGSTSWSSGRMVHSRSIPTSISIRISTALRMPAFS